MCRVVSVADQWREEAARRGIPGPDSNPLVAGERSVPCVWRRHYVAALIDEAERPAFQPLEDLGFEVIQFEDPAELAYRLRATGRRAGTRLVSELLYAPGSLVSARRREWVVLGGSSAETLQVRPVTGSDEDRTLIHLPLGD